MRLIAILAIGLILISIASAFTVGEFTIERDWNSSFTQNGSDYVVENNPDSTNENGATRKENCKSSWACEEWSECVSFSRERTCTDSNQCVTPLEKIDKGFCILPSKEIAKSIKDTAEKIDEALDKPSPIFNISYFNIVSALLILSIIFAIYFLVQKLPKKRRRKKKH